jgi:hypothetical protein
VLAAAAEPALTPASLAVLAHRYGAGAPRVVELIRRTGGCTSPIRLEGESVALLAGSRAVVGRRSTRAETPGFVLVACGNRRESRCPPCSERYRRDAYFLVAAGLAGNEARGVSPSVASHPLVFATFTAPSFGAVHRRVVDGTRVRQCRPGGPTEPCVHGRSPRCLDRHVESDPRIGQALCPDCYDYEASASWNASLGALWRRTVTYLPRELAALCGLSVRELRAQVRVAYAKVAEFQARGALHVHAVIRLDGPDGPETAPTAGATAQRLAEAVARTAARVSVTVEGSSGRELVVRWGQQIDVRLITGDLEDSGNTHGAAVAGYLAKYATKDAQVGGGLDRRIRARQVIERAELSDHARALMRSAWRIGPRWAHSLGFRGHFLTKARRYSVTFAALRGVRAEYRAQADPWLAQIRVRVGGDQVVIRRSFHYAGSGLGHAERAVAASFRASPTWRVSAGSSTAIESVDPRGKEELVHAARDARPPLWVLGTPLAISGPSGSATSAGRPA